MKFISENYVYFFRFFLYIICVYNTNMFYFICLPFLLAISSFISRLIGTIIPIYSLKSFQIFLSSCLLFCMFLLAYSMFQHRYYLPPIYRYLFFLILGISMVIIIGNLYLLINDTQNLSASEYTSFKESLFNISRFKEKIEENNINIFLQQESLIEDISLEIQLKNIITNFFKYYNLKLGIGIFLYCLMIFVIILGARQNNFFPSAILNIIMFHIILIYLAFRQLINSIIEIIGIFIQLFILKIWQLGFMGLIFIGLLLLCFLLLVFTFKKKEDF